MRCAISAAECPPLPDAQTIWAFVRTQPFQTAVQKLGGRLVEELNSVLSAGSRQACNADGFRGKTFFPVFFFFFFFFLLLALSWRRLGPQICVVDIDESIVEV